MKPLFLLLLTIPSISLANDSANGDWIKIFGEYFCSSNWMPQNKQAVSEIQKAINGKTYTHDVVIFENGGGFTGAEDAYSAVDTIEQDTNPYSYITDERLVYPRKIKVSSTTMLVNDKHELPFSLIGCDGVRLTLSNNLDDKNHSRFFGFIYVTPTGFEVCSGNYSECKNPPQKGQYRYRYIFNSSL